MASDEIPPTTLAQAVLFRPISRRPPVPAAPACPLLPTDILVTIIDYIHDTSPSTIPNIRKANGELRALPIYSQLRFLRIDITKDQVSACSYDLSRLESDSPLTAMRSLTVNCPTSRHQYDPETYPYYQTAIARLAHLLPRMTGLKTISWNGLIPEVILETLSRCPDVQLYVECRGLGPQIVGFWLPSLAPIAQLRSLTISQGYTSALECSAITSALKGVLLGSVSLRRLAIDIHLPRGGCKRHSPPTESCGLGMSSDERPPPLEEFNLRDFPGSAQLEVESWPTQWDWPRLRKLVASLDFATLLAPELTAIEEVEIYHHGLHGSDDVLPLLQNLPNSLIALTLPNPPDISDTLMGLRKHGSSLRFLQLHCYEKMRYNAYGQESSTNTWRGRAEELTSNLSQLREICPNLETLALDVPRDGKWPYHIFDDLAKFNNLRHLIIWFELGVNGTAESIQPLVVFSEIAPLFQYIREHQVSKRLQRLDVHSGAPIPRAVAGMPTGRAMWFDHSTTSFTCTLAERDDEAAKNKSTTQCTRLSRVNNVRLAQGEDGPASTIFRPRAVDEATRRFYAGFEKDRQKREYDLAKNGPRPLPRR